MAGDPKPVGRRQRRRIERAVDRAEEVTGLQLCVYLGPSGEDTRAHAEGLFVQAGLQARPAVLVLVAPEQRRVEVVTAPTARERIADEDAAAAVEAMTARFAGGDLAGGIEAGLARLVEAAGPGTAPPGDQELPDVLGE